VGAVWDRDATELTGTSPRARWRRIALLAVTAVCFYVFAPSLAEVFEAWDRLGDVEPLALLAVLGCEVLSFVCVWALQRISLRTSEWFSVATAQLAANAFSRVVPGGGATSTAIQVRMLTDAGFRPMTAASALTVQSLMITAAVAALPVFALPAIIFAGLDVPGSLADGAWIGLSLFLVMLAVGALLLGSRRFACRLGSFIQRIGNAIPRETHLTDVGEKLLEERDEIRRTMGAQWLPALGAAIGRWAFEFFALQITLDAIGADPNPFLVLLAFAFGAALSMIPFTPGGLGFVEAGLTGALVVAGISAGEAVLATLVFRLMSFWLPMPVGAAAAYFFRRRYPRGSSAISRTTK
jgi:hypothetical protein